MNTSALATVVTHWPAILGVLEVVRGAYVDPDARGGSRLLKIARTTATILALPAFLLHSRRLPVRVRCIPAFVAAAHKVAAGLFGLAKNCLLTRVTEGQPYDAVVESATSLHRFAEQSGILRSRTGIEACAGPPRLVRETLDLLVDGKCNTHPDPRPLRELIGEPSELVEYASAVIDVTLWASVAAVWSHATVASLHQLIVQTHAGHERAAAARGAFDDYLQRGFRYPSIEGVLQLPRDVQEAYARGAGSLFRDPGHRQLYSRLSTSSVQSAERSAPRQAIDPEPGALVSRAHSAEREVLDVFGTLRADIEAALGWTSSSAARDRDVIARCFGALPSAYATHVFDLDT